LAGWPAWASHDRRSYLIEIAYSAELALKRIAARVKQGRHDVSRDDVVRRFSRSWINFVQVYQPLGAAWSVYDNSAETPQLLQCRP
jgi:predicted ABC-type ATPase